MIRKTILNPERVRRISKGFAFIPHRFLTDGFLATLEPVEILLYFFLILAADRNGLSFYAYESICRLLGITLEQYISARDGIIEKQLICFDGTLFQVLELPVAPVGKCRLKMPKQPALSQLSQTVAREV